MGCRRAGPTRSLVLAFDTPQTLRVLYLEVEERDVSRTQELYVAISRSEGVPTRRTAAPGIPSVHQARRLSARVGDSAEGVTHLQLVITPDKGGALLYDTDHPRPEVDASRHRGQTYPEIIRQDLLVRWEGQVRSATRSRSQSYIAAVIVRTTHAQQWGQWPVALSAARREASALRLVASLHTPVAQLTIPRMVPSMSGEPLWGGEVCKGYKSQAVTDSQHPGCTRFNHLWDALTHRVGQCLFPHLDHELTGPGGAAGTVFGSHF